MKIFPATGNVHKVNELAKLLQSAGIEVGTLNQLGLSVMPDVDETAGTFEGNALLKANALMPYLGTGEFALADDSGLEVDCLDGEPGVYSARYAGPEASDAENRARLLRKLNSVPVAERTARFRCCLAMISPDQGPWFFVGKVEGVIISEELGEQGFGYDPIFVPEGYTETFAELGSEVKDRISHRAKAVQSLLTWFAGRKE